MNLKSGNIIKKPAPVLAIGDAGHHAVQQEKERGNDESVKKYFAFVLQVQCFRACPHKQNEKNSPHQKFD